MAYAGSAKGLSLLASRSLTLESAKTAVKNRNTMKLLFRGNPKSTFRIHSFNAIYAKYGGDVKEIIKASGRTDSKLNLAAAGAVIGDLFKFTQEYGETSGDSNQTNEETQ